MRVKLLVWLCVSFLIALVIQGCLTSPGNDKKDEDGSGTDINGKWLKVRMVSELNVGGTITADTTEHDTSDFAREFLVIHDSTFLKVTYDLLNDGADTTVLEAHATAAQWELDEETVTITRTGNLLKVISTAGAGLSTREEFILYTTAFPPASWLPEPDTTDVDTTDEDTTWTDTTDADTIWTDTTDADTTWTDTTDIDTTWTDTTDVDTTWTDTTDVDTTWTDTTDVDTTGTDPATILQQASKATLFLMNSNGRTALLDPADTDWYIFTLEAGKTYHIHTSYTADSVDTYLSLYDSAGVLLERNDDDENSFTDDLNAGFLWTATYSGFHYLAVKGYSETGEGWYKVTGENVVLPKRALGAAETRKPKVSKP